MYHLTAQTLLQTRSKADEAVAAGRDDDEADEAVFKMEAELDRCLLRLIAAACKGTRTIYQEVSFQGFETSC